ncbi:MAG: hypothetical protein ACRCYU_15535 [Nocardioides sp.]
MRPARKRYLRIGAVLVALSMLVAATWYVASQAESPVSRSARRGPPKPSVITVPVVAKRLVERETLPCEVSPRDGETIVVTAAPDAGDPIVTRRPIPDGGRVREGDVLIEISGQPVFAIRGRLPTYRDLAVGSSGPDVDQFEVALNRLGLLSSYDVGGKLTKATAVAVKSLYTRAGYDPPRAAKRGTVLVGKDTMANVRSLPGVVRSTKLRIGRSPADGTLSVGPPGAVVRCDVDAGRKKEFRQAVRFRLDGRNGDTVGLDLRAVTQADAEQADEEPLGTAGGVSQTTLVLQPRTEIRRRSGAATVEVMLRRASSSELVVPATALWRTADGTDVVTVYAEGTKVDVPVTIVFQGLAEVQVSSQAPGELESGDQVVVGVGP